MTPSFAPLETAARERRRYQRRITLDFGRRAVRQSGSDDETIPMAALVGLMLAAAFIGGLVL